MKKKLMDFYARLSKREKLILFGTVVMLGVFVTDKVIIGPSYRKMTALDADIQAQEAAIKKSVYVQVQEERILAEGKEFMSYSVESQNPEQEMVGLLKEIESTADSAGVSLLYVKPAKEEGDGSVKKYFANLECEAEMEQVATFFHGIESSTKLLKVEKYEIQPKNKESSIARCTITISKTVLSR